jgi:GxxExxY protein
MILRSESLQGGTQELMKRPWKIEELTGKIIGAAINVHQELGPGFLESVYEEALALEFEAQASARKEKVIPILYPGPKVGEHRLDFLVEAVSDC